MCQSISGICGGCSRRYRRGSRRSFAIIFSLLIVHGKRAIGGFASRIPEDQLRRMAALPALVGFWNCRSNCLSTSVPTAARRPFIRAQLKELLEHSPVFYASG